MDFISLNLCKIFVSKIQIYLKFISNYYDMLSDKHKSDTIKSFSECNFVWEKSVSYQFLHLATIKYVILIMFSIIS